MSARVDSLRGAGPPDPPDASDGGGEATDCFRAPTTDDATERFRAPRPEDEARPEPPASGTGNPWFDAAAPAGPVPGAPAADDARAPVSGNASSDDGPAGAGPDDEPATGTVGMTPDDRPPGRPVTGTVGMTPDDRPDDEPVTGTAGTADGVDRPRRRSRGMRVPSAPPRAATTSSSRAARPADGDLAYAGMPSAPVAAALTATAPRVGLATGGPPGSPPPVLPVGGPPPPSSAPTPPPRTAALGRLVLVLVLVAAVVGTVVVLQQRSQFGRTDAGPDEIPALEVAPAQVDLGSVTQPTALAPPESLLPGTATSRPSGQGAPTISSWANGLGPKTNIPPIALQAYGMADLTMRQVDPQCHMSWVTIAGLARIESNHGRYRGAHIAPNGDIDPRIVGVPLDGTSGNRTISDTDGGVLDGDPTLDRAVGPLQFIPSTWAKWRADGNNDGRADPDNIFDAALAAGHYLCAGGRDLASGQGWRAAVLSYNNSDDYGRRVYAAAQAYANSTTP
jgi:membrane-bound lytic murein transglycosylase B